MGIFDIFGDVVKLTESDNVTKLNDVDMSKVTQEEFNDAMDFLDGLKDNDFVTLLIGDEYIDNFKEELQTKWDMTHESPEPEPKNVPTGNTVDSQIDKLVDEYMGSLDIPDNSLMKKLVPMAKASYKKFAEFIYNHE
jgi:hypothetical protein